ncbi:MAG: single-stranded-DNA-specific exonuclease RecJ [Anaerolineales bacterium]
MRNIIERWVFPKLDPVPGLFQAKIGGSSLVAKTLYQRGYTSVDTALGFLDPVFYTPSPPSDLPGLFTAADRLESALKGGKNILIWGDFDVDGQTSTTLLYSGLVELGGSVTYYIPIRASESHGVSPASLQDKIDRFQPDLLITCDTGIDAVDAVRLAREQNLEVIITDHHQLPDQLPDANSIVNPNLLPADHPLRTLPGVGVAYKLIEELFSRQDRDSERFLDLVALGVVADVAEQVGDTRFLLQRGLEILRTSPRPGLSELYRFAGIDQREITEDQIGFVIGPRLNALGRLDDANSSVDFLTTSEPGRAHKLAEFLENLNRRRQELTEDIYQEAVAMIERSPSLVEDYPVIVLAGSSTWNPGVIGIVASRIVDRFFKPVIMLSQDGGDYRGSARSIEGVNITKLISESSGLLTSFGGHPMAAGMSLPAENVTKFRSSLSEDFHRIVGPPPEEVRIDIDAELSFNEISLDFITDIQRLAPFGAGNPKLLFATRGLSINAERIIGKNKNHRKITLTDPSGTDLDFLWWNSAQYSLPSEPIDAAYSLDLTTFRDQLQIQATIQHIRHSSDEPVYLKSPKKINFQDFRQSQSPMLDLESVISSGNVQVWAELKIPPGVQSRNRLELMDHPTLVIWTSPPNRQVLSTVVSQVSPSEIILFAIEPTFPSQRDFIQALLGLLKHLKLSDKEFDLERFAQALALPQDVIEIGLEWIHLQGDFYLSSLMAIGDFEPGPGTTLPGFQDIDRRLKLMLQEVSAYRRYYKTAPVGSLL